MLPGPVFAVEMVTTARRRRYHAIRVLYGGVLLLIIWQSYLSSFRSYTGSPAAGGSSVHQMSAFARQTFQGFVVTQAIAIGLLTPTLVAGVIADEKQRKTLHYLLASSLTGGEIVLGKLAARLLHLSVFLAIGLPVLSLLSLFGGVDPREIIAAYVGTGAGMFFLAGLSILVSTYARRVRDAILVAYLLGLSWLAFPPLIAYGLSGWWPTLYAWVRPVNDWAFAASPMTLEGGPMTPLPVEGLIGLWDLAGLPAPDPLRVRFGCMVGLQLAYGAGCVAVAVWRLRPAFRHQQTRGRWAIGMARWRWRLLPRPACGDDAMLWKERYVTRLRGWARLVATLVALVLFAFFGYWLWDLGSKAFEELGTYGYGAVGWAQAGARQQLRDFLQASGTFLYVLTMLGVACTAAGGVSSEREEDTWISLTSTPLEGLEVLRAKMLGAAWSLRWFALALVLLWATGLSAGAVHPLGFLALLIELAVYTWFVVALGTFVSLGARTTIRAQAWTIGLLAFLNGGYLLILAPLEPDSPVILAGCTPLVVSLSPLSYEDVWALLGLISDASNWSPFRPGARGREYAAACVLSVMASAFGALVLTLAAFVAFDRVVDRPRWDPRKPPPPGRDRKPVALPAQATDDEIA